MHLGLHNIINGGQQRCQGGCGVFEYLGNSQKERVILGVWVFILIYKDNDKVDSGVDVMISVYQDRSPKRCLNILNVPGVVDIGRDDDSVPYSHLFPELGESIYHI